MDVRKSVADPMFDADVNIRGTLNLLECARQIGVQKIVYISSGGAAYGEPVYLPCDGDHPINPLCPYGVTKHTVEYYLFLYKELYGLDYAVLRYPNVYGPRQDALGVAGEGLFLPWPGKAIHGNHQVLGRHLLFNFSVQLLATLLTNQGYRAGQI